MVEIYSTTNISEMDEVLNGLSRKDIINFSVTARNIALWANENCSNTNRFSRKEETIVEQGDVVYTVIYEIQEENYKFLKKSIDND